MSAALAELVGETARATAAAASTAVSDEDGRALARAAGVLETVAAVMADQSRPATRGGL